MNGKGENRRANSLPPLQEEGRPKARKVSDSPQKHHTTEEDSDSEESLTEVSVEHKPKTSKGSPSKALADGATENVDLNSTQMFTLNSSAKLLPDGSLDYSSNNAFTNLPLTPVLPRRKADVPPLDLTALRSSSDSVMSSLNFQPYSGTVRSTDTYRPGERSQYQYLGAVPEHSGDMNV